MERVELPSQAVTCSFKNASRLLHVDFVLVGVSMLERSKSGNHYAGDTMKVPSIMEQEKKRKGRRKRNKRISPILYCTK